jgi:hypothetical protein
LTFTSWFAPGPACPSPPGLAPGLVLCFTWPSKCFAGCDFWCVDIAVEEQWCSWCGLVLCTGLWCPWSCAGRMLYSLLWVPLTWSKPWCCWQLWCCQHTHCMQWLSCLSCLSPNLISSSLCGRVVHCYEHSELVPIDFMNRFYTWLTLLNGWSIQILHLIYYTQWCNGNWVALVWE